MFLENTNIIYGWWEVVNCDIISVKITCKLEHVLFPLIHLFLSLILLFQNNRRTSRQLLRYLFAGNLCEYSFLLSVYTCTCLLILHALSCCFFYFFAGFPVYDLVKTSNILVMSSCLVGLFCFVNKINFYNVWIIFVSDVWCFAVYECYPKDDLNFHAMSIDRK